VGGGVCWVVIVCGGGDGSSDGRGFGRGAWGGGDVMHAIVNREDGIV